MFHKSYLFPLLLVLGLVLSACAPAATAPAPSNIRTLSVSGQGTTYLAPDIAYVTIGVHTENESAADAVAENNLQTQQLITALRNNGIDPKDIQTSNFSIYQNYRYDDQGRPTMPYYAVDNSVIVTVRDLKKLGDLLDAAVKAGANSVSGISFDIADKTEALKKAREEAVKNAQQQAQELAALAGLELGKVQAISFSESYPGPYFLPYGKGGAGGMGGAEAAVPVQPGQLSVSVTVNITYEIK